MLGGGHLRIGTLGSGSLIGALPVDPVTKIGEDELLERAELPAVGAESVTERALCRGKGPQGS